jgi:hypothetical protein
VAHLSLRASSSVVRRVDELAEKRGCSRSAAIKQAIVEATTPDHVGPVPDEAELLALLGEAARSGSVPAMRELLAHHRQVCERPEPVETFWAELDALAARRLEENGS